MNDRAPIYAKPAPPTALGPFDGVLLVDKPAGPTSHDVVDCIRSHFGIEKVGHGGTLDPQATGLLVLLLGRATKLSNVFIGSDKAYEGILRLGVSTDSQDSQGKITREADYRSVTEEQLRVAMEAMQGDIMQTPPMVSAVKIGGVPLYKHARKNREVERKAKLIHIYEFTLTNFAPPDGDFTVRCTKGTYVRTLCADVGETLGCGAHLACLRRTQSGALSVNDAMTLEELTKLDRESLRKRILPMSRFVTGIRN